MDWKAASNQASVAGRSGLRNPQRSAPKAGEASVAREPGGVRSRVDVPTVAQPADPEAHRSAYPSVRNVRPALRGFLAQYAMFAIGVYLALRPDHFWSLFGITFDAGDPLGETARLGLRCLGVIYLLKALIQFIGQYVAHRYQIDAYGVVQMQWYLDHHCLPRRRASRINFLQLRAIDVDQGLVQTVLSLGTVRLAAGGTDTYEVELRNVSHPQRLRSEFQQRQHQAALAMQVGATRTVGADSEVIG